MVCSKSGRTPRLADSVLQSARLWIFVPPPFLSQSLTSLSTAAILSFHFGYTSGAAYVLVASSFLPPSDERITSCTSSSGK